MDNNFLKNLDAVQVREIVDCMYEKRIKMEQYVIKEGDPGQHLYVAAGKLSQSDRIIKTILIKSRKKLVCIIVMCLDGAVLNIGLEDKGQGQGQGQKLRHQNGRDLNPS